MLQLSRCVLRTAIRRPMAVCSPSAAVGGGGTTMKKFQSTSIMNEDGNKKNHHGATMIDGTKEPRSSLHHSLKREDVELKGEPPSPMPTGYVPVAERQSDDPSLIFLKKSPQHESALMEKKAAEELAAQQLQQQQELPEGCIAGPVLTESPPRQRVYFDGDGERLQSTSVYAGRPLVEITAADRLAMLQATEVAENRIDAEREEMKRDLKMGWRTSTAARGAKHHATLSAFDAEIHDRVRNAEAARLKERLSIFDETYAADARAQSDEKERARTAAANSYANMGGASSSSSLPTDSAPNIADPSKPMPTAVEKTVQQQLEEDLRRLEYYETTPQYPKLLEEFKQKYNTPEIKKKMNNKVYSPSELEMGLQGEPIDFHRLSGALQAKLRSGVGAYHPAMMLERQGAVRMEGYAFNPLQHKGDGNILPPHLRGNVSQELQEQMTQQVDNHILYRTLGLNDVQRYQLRHCLQDLDVHDTNSNVHVLFTYPYADWLQAFYMFLVGYGLYRLQVRWKAYSFYDEYLGLDLRQTPTMEKPVLLFLTGAFMFWFMFQPLTLAAIATNRAYRIVMKRPIGPP